MIPGDQPWRRLIVNADDLGQSVGINRGIAQAVDEGIVTSASLMVRWPAAPQGAAWACAHPCVSIGLHVDFGEWSYVDGQWVQLYHVVDMTDRDAVDAELSRQLGLFLRLMGQPPTHLDSHQHLHREEPLRALLVDVGRRLGVPVRDTLGSVQYRGDFYGQYGAGHPYLEGITFAALLRILDDLAHGTTELGCHPGVEDLTDLNSMYGRERSIERDVLCDPRLPDALAARGIGLHTHGGRVVEGRAPVMP